MVTKFEALNVDLGILGQTLHGDFSFDKVTSGATAGSLRIAATNVSIGLGDGTTNFLSITNGHGSLLLTPQGVAGSFAASVATNFPGFEFGVGAFSVEINTTAAPVNTVFAVGTTTIPLDLPAGPYLRLAAEQIVVKVAGQELTADFSFEQTGSALTGNKIVRLAVANLTLKLTAGATDVLTLSNGSGAARHQRRGLAGRIGGTVT